MELARRGMRVLVHGRSPDRVAAVAGEINRMGGAAAPLVADLASLRQVRELARAVTAATDRLDVLVNNAGVYRHQRELTEDGLETTFAVNHLAPFLLTTLLLDLLHDSAPARVITVSSIAHTRGRIDFDNLQGERRFDGYGAYAASKLANILFTRALAGRLAGTGVTANALHPGVVSTKLLREGFGTSGIGVAEGAATSVYLATAPEVGSVSGEYFVNRRAVKPATSALDDALAERLWRESERLVGG